MKHLIKQLITPLLFSLLTACGSGGGSPSSTKVCENNCNNNGSSSSLNNQEWVWDEENYDSFAHQQMATITLNSLNSYLAIFETYTENINENREINELADKWNTGYTGTMDNYIDQVKLIILNIYGDYSASTTPEQYLMNSLDTIDILKARLTEHYNDFIVEKFASDPDAIEHLSTLDFIKPYIATLDTVAVEISMEIQ